MVVRGTAVVLPTVGSGALLLALVAAGSASLAGWRGRAGLAVSGLAVAAGALAIAVGSLARAFFTLDLGNAYVAGSSRRATDGVYRLAGVWGGMDGSLLLWTAMLALVALGGAASAPAAARGRYVGVVAGIVAGLASVSRFAASPFRRLDLPAVDGDGLTPILEHPAMLYHPPLLYLGLVVTVVPYALVISGGSAGAAVRRWSAGAAAVLTAGLATGANWAYVEIGWGGYWGWDPVENAALVPWLALVAGMHVPARLRRGRPLVVAGAAPFVLASVGAVVARSGANVSVHSFAEDPAVGWSLGAVLAAVAATATRAWWRAAPAGPRWPRSLGVGAVVVGALAAALVLTGVLYPVAAGWFGADESVVAGRFYARVLAPLGAVAVAGNAWALARGGWRRPAQLAAHLGVAVMAIGVVGSMFATGDRVVLAAGETVEVGGYRFTNESVVAVADDMVAASVAVDRGADRVATLRPELRVFPERSAALAETALRSTPRDDIQVALRRAGDDGVAVFDIAVRPLVWWVWWGAALMAVGLAIATVTRPGRAFGRAAGRGSPTAPSPRVAVRGAGAVVEPVGASPAASAAEP